MKSYDDLVIDWVSTAAISCGDKLQLVDALNLNVQKKKELGLVSGPEGALYSMLDSLQQRKDGLQIVRQMLHAKDAESAEQFLDQHCRLELTYDNQSETFFSASEIASELALQRQSSDDVYCSKLLLWRISSSPETVQTAEEIGGRTRCIFPEQKDSQIQFVLYDRYVLSSSGLITFISRRLMRKCETLPSSLHFGVGLLH